jgi:uncharacterized protein YcbX
LEDLNARLKDQVPMNRFRPNLVFKGGKAFEEDDFNQFKIGDAVFRAAKPCGRCIITTIDQATGIQSKEPLRTMASYRTVNNNVLFGQNLVLVKSGWIKVGDYLVADEKFKDVASSTNK